MSTEDTPRHAGLPDPDTHCWDDDTNNDVWSYSQGLMRATIDAAVAKERERLRVLVEAIRDANCDAENVNTFRLLKPGQERAWLALMAGLEGPNVEVSR